MVPRTSSKAIAVIVVLWVAACAAALALATTAADVAQADECTGGGGSPSPSGSSAAPPASEGPLTFLPSLIPDPAPDGNERAAAKGDPSERLDAAAQPDRTCKSTVTIAYDGGRNAKFTGKVGSDEPMCRRARDVTVLKVKRGKDARVGKAVTNARGRYTVPARQANGRFYAKVSAATTENDEGQTVRCQSARSRAIRP
ncbi:MAG TPA: hypothetical protein VHN37_14910 [Actinomycetota bacterium]|nr:hypothetical protein [Actinomycetota bacterium]